MTLIQAQNFSKSFDGGKSYALKNVTLSIGEGELVAIIGLSGAGKSTFLRSINGLNSTGQGKLVVLGQNLGVCSGKHLVNLRKQIGFIYQHLNLIKNISVMQNVLLGRLASVPLWRALTGSFAEEDKELALRTLRAVGLEEKRYEKVRTLSGGQQQRVAIARALVQNPKIILADEPMASLDPALAEKMIQILHQINKDKKITVLVNIHLLELAKKYAHRILAFREGTLLFDGPPSALNEMVLAEIYRVEPKETL